MKDASWVELVAGNYRFCWVAGLLQSQKLPCLKVMCVFLTYQAGLIESYFLYSNIIKRLIDRFSFSSSQFLDSDCASRVQTVKYLFQMHAGVREWSPRPGVGVGRSEVKGVPSEPGGKYKMCFLKCIIYFELPPLPHGKPTKEGKPGCWCFLYCRGRRMRKMGRSFS